MLEEPVPEGTVMFSEICSLSVTERVKRLEGIATDSGGVAWSRKIA
jgi:hypothetical protein